MGSFELGDLLPLPVVAQGLPRDSHGRKIHVCTLRRWMTHGLRGVRLQGVQTGGRTYTTLDYVRQFLGAVTAARAKNYSHASGKGPSSAESIAATLNSEGL